MITSLTKEQTDKFSYYVDKYTKIGLSTKQRNLNDAIIDFSLFQEKILQRKKIAPVVILQSPLECNIACLLTKSTTSQVRSQVLSQVDSQVDSQVRSQVDSQVASQVLSQVSSQVYLQVYSQVASQDSQVYPYFDCQFWASYFAYYDFMKYELNIELGDKYDIFKRCVEYGMVFPMEDLCIVCQCPTIIKTNKYGLHCVDGAALSYGGNNEIYALNGVAMEKEYVMSKASEISGDMIMKEDNVEVRRELIKKVGIERIFSDFPHKLLDKMDNYELYSIDLSKEVKGAKYLKMTNPSVNCFHFEAVAPDIVTINDALKWRNNNMFINAEILT